MHKTDWRGIKTGPDWLQVFTKGLQSVSVPIVSLVLEDSPRQAGEDPAHTRMLAELIGTLPPIVVHRPTMRVIDGMHRTRAAMLAGQGQILAKLCDCSEDEAFILSVKANVTHGLPLPETDRRLAAERIIKNHPDWSDRVIAIVTGLSDKTVGSLRHVSTAEFSQSKLRRGRDGRLRPINTTEQRRLAAKIISEDPDMGLREIAKTAGISLSTAHDVRQRVRRNEDPVPLKYRVTEESEPTAEEKASVADIRPASPLPRHRSSEQRLLLALTAMKRDPSLRLTESGRRLLRWLHLHMFDPGDVSELLKAVPPHWAGRVADMAQSCADSWHELAVELQRRADGGEWTNQGA